MKRLLTIASACVMLFSVGISNSALAALPPAVNNTPMPSLAPLLKTVLPSVVNIAVLGELPAIPADALNANPNSDSKNNKQQNRILPGDPSQDRQFASLGSGVIVNAEKGYILTNAHLLRDAKAISVTLNDGRQLNGKVIGSDPGSDVAVIQIKADKLQALPLANSDDLQVGDFVVAIGSPFGLKQSVTSGIISALQRNNLGIEGLENFIQTDASINPGNSGGALINLKGQLIGINTAILAPTGGNVGIGFAIPSNLANSVMAQLVEYGSVRRGLMGVLIQNLTPELASAFQIPNIEGGAIIPQVNPYSPAAKAGFKAGDVIVKVNGKTVRNAGEVTNAIGLLRAGSSVTLDVLRDGKPLTLSVVTEEPQKYTEESARANPLLNGISLRDFSGLSTTHGRVIGAQIVGIADNSPAILTVPSLSPGDVIVSANQKPVKNIQDLESIAKASNNGLLLNVLRGSGAFFTVLK